MYVRPEIATSVHDQILGILRHEEFTDEIIKALDAQGTTEVTEENRELARRELLEAMVGRVAVDVKAHPRREVMIQLLRDSTILRRADFYGFLDFFHSCLVCHFKGELAEILAWPLLRKFAERLVDEGLAPPGAQIVPGWKINERWSAGSGRWLKGSDALFMLPLRSENGDKLLIDSKNEGVMWGIVATAEIKSSRNELRKVFVQSANHVRRFRFGLHVGDTLIDASKLRVPGPGKKREWKWKMPAPSGICKQVQRLAIRPVTLIDTPNDLIRGEEAGTWVGELHIPSSYILEAAYRFAAWYVGLAGRQVYCKPGTIKEGCVVNPHPEMSFEEAAENALIEALYFFGHDEERLQMPKKGCTYTALELHRRRTFNWLFNSLSYGHDQAAGTETRNPADISDRKSKANVLTSDSATTNEEQSASSKKLIERCNQSYKCGDQASAAEAVKAAKLCDLPPDASLRVRWLEAMIEYRNTEFVKALELFPVPEASKRDFWGLRDQIMVARLNARCGFFDKAFQLLTALLPLPGVYADLPVEHSAVTALAFFMKGDKASADREAERTLHLLQELRCDIKNREEKNQGSPLNVNVACIHMSIFDLASVLVGLGRINDAVKNLQPIRGFIGWEPNYLRKDPMLAPLFSDPKTKQTIDDWLKKAYLPD